jgi:hypothetical protein
MPALLSELAQGLCFLLSVASLFHLLARALFLLPGTHWQTRLPGALEALALATALCLATGLLFALTTPTPQPEPVLPRALLRTLPVQLLLWTIALAAILFFISAYLEEHYVPLLYRNQPHEISTAPPTMPPHRLRSHAINLEPQLREMHLIAVISKATP